MITSLAPLKSSEPQTRQAPAAKISRRFLYPDARPTTHKRFRAERVGRYGSLLRSY